MRSSSLLGCRDAFKPLDMAVDTDKKVLTGRLAPTVRLPINGRQIVFSEEPADQLLPVAGDA